MSRSERWFTDIEKYSRQFVHYDRIDGHAQPSSNNKLLAENIQLSLNQKETRRNNNSCVIGDNYNSIAESYIIPNVMQLNGNYLIHDKGGNVYDQTKDFLRSNGYDVHIFDIAHPETSAHLNPILNMSLLNQRRDEDIDKIVTMILPRRNDSSLYFLDAERKLLAILIAYALERGCTDDMSIRNLLNQIVKIENGTFEKEIAEFESTRPFSLLSAKYQDIKQIYGKSFSAIIKSMLIGVILCLYNVSSQLIDNTTIQSNQILMKKQAFFIVYNDADIYDKQILDLITYSLLRQIDCLHETRSENNPNISMFIDASRNNIIKEMLYRALLFRKNNINWSICIDNFSEFLEENKNDCHNIINSCDSHLYLGSKDKHAHKFLKSFLEIIRGENLNEFDDTLIKNLPTRDCILIIRGLLPFYDRKCKINTDMLNHANQRIIRIKDEWLASFKVTKFYIRKKNT